MRGGATAAARSLRPRRQAARVFALFALNKVALSGPRRDDGQAGGGLGKSWLYELKVALLLLARDPSPLFLIGFETSFFAG